jgi:hypothetical protein
LTAFEEGRVMRRKSPDWFRLLLLLSIVVTASALLSPRVRADERRTLIRNAALILTMDPSVRQGELGLIANAELLFEATRSWRSARGCRSTAPPLKMQPARS